MPRPSLSVIELPRMLLPVLVSSTETPIAGELVVSVMRLPWPNPVPPNRLPPPGPLKVTLVSRSNRELGTATTDAQGYARFDAGLTRGRKGAEPGLVVVEDGDTDMAFLSMTDPAFDLSDRGVEGRAPAGPIDLFLTK